MNNTLSGERIAEMAEQYRNKYFGNEYLCLRPAIDAAIKQALHEQSQQHQQAIGELVEGLKNIHDINDECADDEDRVQASISSREIARSLLTKYKEGCDE